MIPRADPDVLPYVKPKVERFLEFCRNRAAEHKRPEPAIEPQPQRQFVPRPPQRKRKSEKLPIIVEWLTTQTEPQLREQIAEATGINPKTVHTILRGNPKLFESVGKVQRGTGNAKLWRVRPSQ